MKHWLALAVVLLLGLGAVVKAERDRVDVPPGPAALLYFVADGERELTRLPMRYTRLSDEEEIRIGDELASSYQSQPQDSDDAEVQRYVQQVGATLAAHAHRKLPYRFHYLASDGYVNAFALPGGHVYIGKGLLTLMDSEDELASVLGHEIEHIDHYHCAERAQQERVLRQVPLGGVIALPIEIFEAGYSKNQELEADLEGSRLAVAAGYSEAGAISMFEKLDRLQRQRPTRAGTPGQEVSRVAWEALQGYFRSHPLPAERMAQLQRTTWEDRPMRPLAVKKTLDDQWLRQKMQAAGTR
jgi:predicted Zn-dependent protease